MLSKTLLRFLCVKFRLLVGRLAGRGAACADLCSCVNNVKSNVEEKSGKYCMRRVLLGIEFHQLPCMCVCVCVCVCLWIHDSKCLCTKLLIHSFVGFAGARGCSAPPRVKQFDSSWCVFPPFCASPFVCGTTTIKEDLFALRKLFLKFSLFAFYLLI